MGQVLIHQYLNELSDLKRASGSHRETVVREAFKSLLKNWGRSQSLIFVPEYEYQPPNQARRYIDGALVDQSRLPVGFWEAKDEADDLEAEINLKFRRGYPQDNIILEDSREAILIQNKQRIMQCPVDKVDQLSDLLHRFFDYESEAQRKFRKAVEQFKDDLPAVLSTLRKMIDVSYSGNRVFHSSAIKFLQHARETTLPLEQSLTLIAFRSTKKR